MKSVLHHYTVQIRHKVPGYQQHLLRKVDPYKLWYVNEGLYLVGFDHRSEDMRVFAVHRVESATLTSRRFKVPPTFSFDEFTKSAFQLIGGEGQHVVIRFRADQVPFITERIWHSSQRITQQNDGGIVFEMDVADLGEVSRWLMGFGASAEVLEPEGLRSEIAEELNAALSVYQQ